jgi:Protein of unknown function (DUF2889)
VPLNPSPVSRRLIHTRRVEFQGFLRDDGLWDIEASVSDVKTIDCPLESGVRPAGQPIHLMRVRLTIDEQLNIRAAEAVGDAVAYPGFCDAIAPAYAGLVGLNLGQGFRARTVELLGGLRGCTHMTELLAGFPTAAIQAMFRRAPEGTRPFQLDRCHALDTAGETVRRYYPRWHEARHTSSGG